MLRKATTKVHVYVYICMFPGVVTATHTICYGQDKMAFNLHPIICTWDSVTTCIPVTVFFTNKKLRTSGTKRTSGTSGTHTSYLPSSYT